MAEKQESKITYSDEDKRRAAYALNMCTVSVSQIVEYNDLFVLEQEYDAILNNINLEQVPKEDEALLRTLVELLNTITFFRIQEIKKEQIEKKYQNRMKNAIWSAVPNISMFIAAGSTALVQGPLAALSVATTVGSAYMNYRREKNQILTDKEKEEVELEITAIEQFNALRRELFTTSWRLAATYEFPDKYRLTERQIKQYNEILMDQDEYRKYARLEYIQDMFEAYPPFWYFFGHTAHYIAEQNLPCDGDTEEEAAEKAQTRAHYLNKAKKHLEKFRWMNQYSILREDQMASSALLEYIDLLLLENPDKKDISEMIFEAVKHAGNSFDLLQMCAISFLKIAEFEEASKILKMLVNEDYNALMNAKILSRLYVNDYVNTKNIEARANYKTLESRVPKGTLFPMPKSDVALIELEKEFIGEQKEYVKELCLSTLRAYVDKMSFRFNTVLPAPSGDGNDSFYEPDTAFRLKRIREAEKLSKNKGRWEPYVAELGKEGFRSKYCEIINDSIKATEEILDLQISESKGQLISASEKEELLDKVKQRIIENSFQMTKYQELMESEKFSFDDYKRMLDSITFDKFMFNYFLGLKTYINKKVNEAESIGELERIEDELASFREKNELWKYENEQSRIKDAKNKYFELSLFGEDAVIEDEKHDYEEELLEVIKSSLDRVVVGDKNFQVYLKKEDNFRVYINESKVDRQILSKALAVFDDRGLMGKDLILCTDCFVITKDKSKETLQGRYSDVSKEGKEPDVKLKCNNKEFYSNSNVNSARLYDLMKKLVN